MYPIVFHILVCVEKCVRRMTCIIGYLKNIIIWRRRRREEEEEEKEEDDDC